MKTSQLLEYNLIIETREIFFLINHAENGMEKLFPDPFLKNQN